MIYPEGKTSTVLCHVLGTEFAGGTEGTGTNRGKDCVSITGQPRYLQPTQLSRALHSLVWPHLLYHKRIAEPFPS